MTKFRAEPGFSHQAEEALGVLLVNLGTPDEPTPGAVRRYLAEFLSDPRVIDTPRALWWLILHGVILRIRPARSARAYRKIWTEDGSPLLLHSRALRDEVEKNLRERFYGAVHVALGMSYGTPSIASAIDELRSANVRRLLLLPLYPQYSSTTTASVFDAVTRELRALRWMPEFRAVNQYHDDPNYIHALKMSVLEHWQQHGRAKRLLMSFHGIPERYLHSGDPYHCQAQKTARLLAEALELPNDEWAIAFQSRVGREPWLQPYTDQLLKQWAEDGAADVDVVCPGFAVDCLETLEEIALQNAELYSNAGGGELRYIRALNASAAHAESLSALIAKHTQGWQECEPSFSLGSTIQDKLLSAKRARDLGAKI